MLYTKDQIQQIIFKEIVNNNNFLDIEESAQDSALFKNLTLDGDLCLGTIEIIELCENLENYFNINISEKKFMGWTIIDDIIETIHKILN